MHRAVRTSQRNLAWRSLVLRAATGLVTVVAGCALSTGPALSAQAASVSSLSPGLRHAAPARTPSSPSTGAAVADFNVTPGTPSSDWTTYMEGNDRTGFATGESGFNPTSVKTLHLVWQTSDARPDHGVFSQPVVSNGLVYWGSFDGYERATDTSGNPVWQTNLGTTSPPGCVDPSEAG